MAIGNIPKTKAEQRRFFDGAAGGAIVAATGVIPATEAGYVKTVLTFANRAISIVDAAGVGARASLKVLDLPQGLIAIAGAVADLTLTTAAVDPEEASGVTATWDGDFGVGTATAAADGTLSSTEQNIIPTTATPQAVGGATTAKGVSTGAVLLDGTATAVDVYLNVLIDDADQDVTTEPSNLLVSGTLTLVWSLIGDK